MEIRQFLVVASVAASPILSILVVALFCYLCKRKLFPILKQRYKKKGSLKFENILLRRFQLVEQEKATNNFSQDCLLGSEVMLLSKVKLKNLVSLVRYCKEPGPKGAKLLVYEYVPNGSQLEYITGKLKGMHCYIYLDPAYCTSLHLTPFSDVYSFGVILLQLVAARPAVYSNGRLSNYHIIDWARPSLEKGSVEEILDVNLLSEPCNMEIMLKMAQLGLRCSVKVPKQRPTMNQVWQELEEALHSVGNFISKKPSSAALISSGSSAPCESMDNDYSQSFVSLNGVGLQRFHVEMESYSFRSTSLRCLEENSTSVEFDKKNLKGNT
ncbi:putative lrr receptor-like serine/threonine-protein kinase [Quercus suber]|uniref:Lrr receptor-like serine/threonine-protein kinase n=1 Tax=Quercus suber TaxID=58331 RepID=A0AAW0LU77_QUESU